MAAPFEQMQNDLLLRTARGEKVEYPPMWIMRQAGRYLPEYHKEKGSRNFFECCQNPEIASNLTIQPVDRFKDLIDAAIIFSDILVIPQAVGMDVQMEEGKGPVFPHPMHTPDEQYRQIMARDVNVEESLNYVYQAITLTRQKLGGRVPLIGFCGAPWTLLCYMAEGTGSKMFFHAKTWIYKYPQESRDLLQKITQICIEHLAQQVAAGAQIVQVFDSWAGELSTQAFDSFALPYLKQIATELPKRLTALGKAPVSMIVFAKGVPFALERLCDSEYNVIGLDWLHDPAGAFEIARRAGKVVQGNADPGILYGNKEAITSAVENMVQGFGGGKQGWIANLGHGITPRATPEALEFYLKEVRRLVTAV